MSTLPSISAQIDEQKIHKVIQDNFAALAPSFFTLTSNWFVRAYDHFKDIDKFIIIIYLVNKDLIFFRKNGLAMADYIHYLVVRLQGASYILCFCIRGGGYEFRPLF